MADEQDLQALQIIQSPDARDAAGWVDGYFLQWKRPLSVLRILSERAELLGRSIINGALLALFLGGFLGGVWQFYQHWHISRSLIDWLNIHNGRMLFFWISLLIVMYLFFRIERERNSQKVIKRKSIGSVLIPATGAFTYSQYQASAKTALEVSEYFDWQAIRTVERAWLLANRMNHPQLEPVHLLAALYGAPRVRVVMARLGIDTINLVQKIKRRFSELPNNRTGEPTLAPATKELFYKAFDFAYREHNPVVDAPDLLLAVAQVHTVSQDILYDLGVDDTKLTNVVKWIDLQQRVSKQWEKFRGRASRKPKGTMDRAMLAQATPVLDHFSRDLTQLARIGGLPLTIGREQELDEIFRIIESGRGSPLIVGSAGVGKEMLLNMLADKMSTEEVPEVLQDKRFVSLNIASLVAGAGGMGELEERLQEIIQEVVKSGNIVLAIENLHTMVGVSSAGGSSLDLSEILTQAVSSGRVIVIATTTPNEYRRFIEPRSNLLSAFQTVNIDEVDQNTAILICEARAGSIEYHHRVFFTYEAIERAVKLSKRYLRDLMLPSSAINVLEEVAVQVKQSRGQHSVVTGEDVAALVSQRAKVTVTKITEDETKKLLNLESIIHERMVDQEEAVKAVASALRRARAELRDMKRPIANLLFLGPTGVGKTELAKTVADVYFNSEQNMTRLDMSEYQDQYSIYRMIGTPDGTSPGYLTEAIRHNPFTLLLLDEIEKAHPDVLNIFLQVMDDGRLTDSSGRTIDFTNVIIVATSNAATPLIQERVTAGVPVGHIKEELMSGGLAQYFRPEFLNRFDNIIVFKPLAPEDVLAITKLLIKEVGKRLKEKGISLEASDEAIFELAKKGYDPRYGARPLRRVIQENVDDALAKFLLTGSLSRRDVAVLEAGGKISIKQARQL